MSRMTWVNLDIHILVAGADGRGSSVMGLPPSIGGPVQSERGSRLDSQDSPGGYRAHLTVEFSRSPTTSPCGGCGNVWRFPGSRRRRTRPPPNARAGCTRHVPTQEAYRLRWVVQKTCGLWHVWQSPDLLRQKFGRRGVFHRKCGVCTGRLVSQLQNAVVRIFVGLGIIGVRGLPWSWTTFKRSIPTL